MERTPDIFPPGPAFEPPIAVARDEDENGPVMFLPGALEVIAGLRQGQEFRMQHTGAGHCPETTLGSARHSHYGRHIQIVAPGVAAYHARLSFEADRWVVRSLSESGPLSVNGRMLSAPTEALALSDGDEIQIGEVTLRYRDSRR